MFIQDLCFNFLIKIIYKCRTIENLELTTYIHRQKIATDTDIFYSNELESSLLKLNMASHLNNENTLQSNFK